MYCKYDRSDAGDCKGCEIKARQQKFSVSFDVIVNGDAACKSSLSDISKVELEEKLQYLLSTLDLTSYHTEVDTMEITSVTDIVIEEN